MANWKEADFSLVYGNIPDADWVTQYLTQEAMRHQGTYYHTVKDCTSTIPIQEVETKLVELGGRLVRHCKRKKYSFSFYLWADGAFSLHGTPQSLSIIYGSSDLETFQKFEALEKEFLLEKGVAGKVFALTAGQNGIELTSVGVAAEKLVEDNYAADVVEDFRHVVEDLNTNDPCGRIVVFDGPVGTGKTRIIRGLLESVPNAIFVLIAPDLVSELGGPNILPPLIEHSKPGVPMVFIVEDADSVLVSRAGDNMGSISSLLNLSDGILGSTLNLRIICTTNSGSIKGTSQMDEAILRPGRLCRSTHVGALSPEHAAEVYQRLTGNTRKFREETTIAEVYRMARDGGWVPEKKEKAIGFSSPVDEDDLDDLIARLK